MGRRGFYCTAAILSCLLLPNPARQGSGIGDICRESGPGQALPARPGRVSNIRKRAFLAVSSLILAGFALAGPAQAGFRVCNHSGQQIDVAFGRPDRTSGWTSEGWWSMPRGQCRRIVKEALNDRYYYLYATGSKGGVWQATGSQKGGHFCVRRKRFVLRNRDYARNGVLDCAAHHLMSRQFLLVDTGGAPDHVHDLKD